MIPSLVQSKEFQPTDRETSRYEDANIRFSQICKGFKKDV